MNDQERNEGGASGTAGGSPGGPGATSGGSASTGGPPGTPATPTGPGAPPGTAGPSGADSPNPSPTPGVPVPPPTPPITDDRPPPPALLDEEDDDLGFDDDLHEGRRATGYGIGSLAAGLVALYLFPAQFVLNVAFQRLNQGPTQLGNWYTLGWLANLLPSALAAIFAIVAASRGDSSVEQGLGSGLSRVGRMLGYGALVLVALGIVALVMSLQPLPQPQVPPGFQGGPGGG
ncbi:MAG TPA: hypothetical protein VM840_10915 [Actinomycetota bacterium]|nr:hypothetical protein [Actinomycetota bacterium]